MEFVTQFNGLHKPQYEETKGPSMTVPDEAMSVAELMRRHAAGLPLGGAKVPLYDSEEDDGAITMEHLDLAERQQFLELYNRIIKENQGPKVQRTTGGAADQGQKPDPDPNILKKPGVQGQSPATSQTPNEQKGGENG